MGRTLRALILLPLAQIVVSPLVRRRLLIIFDRFWVISSIIEAVEEVLDEVLGAGGGGSAVRGDVTGVTAGSYEESRRKLGGSGCDVDAPGVPTSGRR